MTAEMGKQPSSLIPGHILDPILRPGGNVTLNLPKGTVAVNLDDAGDWTITVGVKAGTPKTDMLTDGLKRMGFFQAAESEGVSYLLWTSAFHETTDARALAEHVLFDTLKTVQDTPGTQYIC